MIPSKPKKDESRRSSILKACKPRQPLQNVNLNSSSNEGSPATSKIKRRVSFADKKHVKKFCDSAVQGTVWDRTYEERDSSLRESFEAHQGTKVECKESVSKVATEDDCIDTGIETSSNCTNSCQLRASSVKVYADDKNDLDFITVEHLELFPLRQTILSNLSKSTSAVTTECTDNYKKNCASVIDNEYHSKTDTSKVHPELDKTCIQDLSMEFTGVISLVPMYRGSEDEQKDVQRDHIASHQDNSDTNCSTMEMSEVTSWRNKADVSEPTSKQQENVSRGRRDSITFSNRTRLLHDSMEFTESVLSYHNRMYNNKENATKSLTSNCDNESITEAISMSVKPIQSDLEVVKKVPVIVHNRKDTRHDAASTIFPANLQSTKSFAFSQIQNADCGAMELTNVVRSLVADTDTFDRDSNGNDADFNTSMEMTCAPPFKLYEDDTAHSCDKSAAKEDNLKKSWKDIEGTDKTEFFNDMPMEMTSLASIYNSRLNDENTVAGKDLPKNRETKKNSDETELFSDAPMQITRLINAVLPVNVHDKENLKIDEPMFENHKNMFTDNTSMEITKAISSRSKEEMFDPIAHEKNLLKSNSYGIHDEKTKLLRKSMDITEAVACPVLREKTRGIESTAESTEALISRTPAASRPSLSENNSAGSPLDPVNVNNDGTIDDVSMEMTAAVQSTTRRTEYLTLNGTENLGVSGSDEFQCSTANNAVEPRRNKTGENVTIPRERRIVEATDPHGASSDARVLTDHFDRSLGATSGSVNKKESTHVENASAGRSRSDSLVESQLPVCRSAHSLFRADDKCISVKCSTEDAIDPAQILALPCELNVSDGLNKTDECSFLKRNLENSLVELQSINPPSFVDMSSREENSLLEDLREDRLHASIIADVATINDKDNNPGRLEPTNVEHDETKDCHRNVVMNAIKDNLGTEAIERTIVDDNQIDESNRCATDVEHLDGESASSTSNVSRRNMVTLSSTDRFAETKVTRKDRVSEERYARREINDEVELRNIERRSGEEVERCCIDHLKEAKAAIEDQVDRNECRRENSNGEANPRDVEELKDCVEKKLDAEQRVNGIEEEPLVERDPFLSLAQKVETHAEGKDCIWNVYYKNVDRKMIAFGFMSNSLLIVTFFSDDPSHSEENSIEKIKIVSRIADDADVLMRIVHGLILEKINVGTLNTHSYRTHEDVFPMLDLVSQDVKLAMDFMFDLRRLDNLNLMQIARDKISFVSRSKHMDIILEITINVKRFDKLTPSDISVRCLLGAIRETEIKSLIKNVKKDRKFLRRYMNDAKDYIDIIEEISPTSS